MEPEDKYVIHAYMCTTYPFNLVPSRKQSKIMLLENVVFVSTSSTEECLSSLYNYALLVLKSKSMLLENGAYVSISSTDKCIYVMFWLCSLSTSIIMLHFLDSAFDARSWL